MLVVVEYLKVYLGELFNVLVWNELFSLEEVVK